MKDKVAALSGVELSEFLRADAHVKMTSIKRTTTQYAPAESSASFDSRVERLQQMNT